ncbi:hypothetical protein HK104_000777 [Borealophlyctis nickersoniae]|nr:hypothetical protein HK104_000777 [Borealophlyctis nickersoniae]
MADGSTPKLSKRRLSKDMISAPTQFDHRAHAGSPQEALQILVECQNDYAKNFGGREERLSISPPAVTDLTNMTTVAVGEETKPRSLMSLIHPPWHKSKRPADGQHADPAPAAATSTPPSLLTVERTIAAKLFIEHYFDRLHRSGFSGRAKRRAQMERDLASSPLPETEKRALRAAWIARESERARVARDKVCVDDFETVKILGHGAFGVVKLVREKRTGEDESSAPGEVFAMKMLSKREMLRRHQDSHVRAERDLMSDASEVANWIVRLVYSFQDDEFLYFVMDFMPGGDLLGLLIREDIFSERMAKFYAAEMILAIEEAHKLG